MEKIYRDAFAEIEDVLNIMPIDLVSKIPVQYRKIISENKSENYKCDIKEPLEEQKLKKETVAILGLMYRDFLASPEEREKLQLHDANKLKKVESDKQEQELIVYEQPNFIRKILGTIRGIFNKNKF